MRYYPTSVFTITNDGIFWRCVTGGKLKVRIYTFLFFNKDPFQFNSDCEGFQSTNTLHEMLNIYTVSLQLSAKKNEMQREKFKVYFGFERRHCWIR